MVQEKGVPMDEDLFWGDLYGECSCFQIGKILREAAKETTKEMGISVIIKK